jgi:hypothetical protein
MCVSPLARRSEGRERYLGGAGADDERECDEQCERAATPAGGVLDVFTPIESSEDEHTRWSGQCEQPSCHLDGVEVEYPDIQECDVSFEFAGGGDRLYTVGWTPKSRSAVNTGNRHGGSAGKKLKPSNGLEPLTRSVPFRNRRRGLRLGLCERRTR